MKSIAPVFSTTDLARWCSHYEALGFEVEAYGREYAFARAGSVEVHVSVNPEHDPAKTAGCAYLYVDDPDALHKRWSSVDTGKNVAPVTTDYGMREGAHIDPDNNLLRYGSDV